MLCLTDPLLHVWALVAVAGRGGRSYYMYPSLCLYAFSCPRLQCEGRHEGSASLSTELSDTLITRRCVEYDCSKTWWWADVKCITCRVWRPFWGSHLPRSLCSGLAADRRRPWAAPTWQAATWRVPPPSLRFPMGCAPALAPRYVVARF